MKTFKLVGATCMLLITTSQIALSQANTSLSNLANPTSVSQSLLPSSNCTKDLGSSSRRWRNLYLCSRAGIGISPAYPLDVYNVSSNRGVNVFNQAGGTISDRIGIYSSSVIASNYGFGIQAFGGFYGVYASGSDGSSGGATHGVYGVATATSCTGVVYGVEGYAYGAGANYGIYGSTSDVGCGAFNAAGYFNGSVYAINYFTASDRKFKTNITSIKSPLEQIMRLKPSAYEFNKAEYPNMELPKGKQMGLIADEVKQVFPELVSEAVNAAKYDQDRKLISKEVKYEAVNYMGLITPLIAAIQEQEQTIEAVKTENQELKSRLNAIEQALNINSKQSAAALTDARLDNAIPNPATQQTVIKYYLPQGANSAVLNISDMNGKVVKSIQLTAKGNGQVVLDAGKLAGGTYNYALIVGGQLVGSKRLVLVK
jgi:hypothetical protein